MEVSRVRCGCCGHVFWARLSGRLGMAWCHKCGSGIQVLSARARSRPVVSAELDREVFEQLPLLLES